MRRLITNVLSIAALLVLAIGPSFAAGNCCNGGACCDGGSCCHHHSSK